MNYVVSLIQIVFMLNLALGDDCRHQPCDCGRTPITCNLKNLTEIPLKLFNESSSLINLYFFGKQVTTIPAGSLPGNLSEVSFTSVPIETIDDTAFDESIYTLQGLSFTEARFTQIPEAVFHLKALKSLQIYDTNILVWNEESMNQLGTTVKTFSLSNVGLKSWPTWMKSMTNLTELTISKCFISNIPDDALNIVTKSLTSLDLSSNGLNALPKSMSNLTVLSTLTLNHNKIIDVTWLPQLSPITSLYLDSNKITDAKKLSNVLRPFANTLSEFIMQDNSLTSFLDVSFLTQLPSLDYDMNHISDANSGSLPSNLTSLYVDSNFLVSIPSIMNNLKFLSVLSLQANNIQIVQGSHIPICLWDMDLSDNAISLLTQSSFPHNSSLQVLTLSNNPLSTISPDAFTNIPLLTQLTIQSTKITRLPLALASLTKLNIFIVSDSKSLICTCEEQSLRPLIQSLGSFGTMGDCGMTDIYYFFEVLSPECPQTP